MEEDKKEIKKMVEEIDKMFKDINDIKKQKEKWNKDLKNYLELFQSMLKPYLFRYKNDNSTKSWHDLLTMNYDRPNMIIPCTDNSIRKAIQKYHSFFYEIKQVYKNFLLAHKKFDQYCNIKSDKFKKFFNKINDLEKRKYYFEAHAEFFRYRRIYNTRKPSKGEARVKQFLDRFADNYEFYYFYQCRWNWCKDKRELEFDFYCCLFYECRFVHWVIECDGLQHHIENNLYDFASNHRHDIMKQYYLFWLNIPLLRINFNDPNIEITIVNFINDILVSTKYVTRNPIVPIEKYFQDENPNQGLVYFNCHHLEMHMKCLFFRNHKVKPVSKLFDVYDFDPFYVMNQKPVKLTRIIKSVSDNDNSIKSRKNEKYSVIVL